jgi:hypothetical protein
MSEQPRASKRRNPNHSERLNTTERQRLVFIESPHALTPPLPDGAREKPEFGQLVNLVPHQGEKRHALKLELTSSMRQAMVAPSPGPNEHTAGSSQYCDGLIGPRNHQRSDNQSSLFRTLTLPPPSLESLGQELLGRCRLWRRQQCPERLH